mgnify:CR=1 FL=1
MALDDGKPSCEVRFRDRKGPKAILAKGPVHELGLGLRVVPVAVEQSVPLRRGIYASQRGLLRYKPVVPSVARRLRIQRPWCGSAAERWGGTPAVVDPSVESAYLKKTTRSLPLRCPIGRTAPPSPDGS